MTKRYASVFCLGLMAIVPMAISAQSGTLDPTYGNGGIAILQPGDFHDVAYDALALDDNTSLVCGVARHNGRNAIFITHLLEDGSVDAGFGTDGGYTFFNVGEEAYGYAMDRDAQGRIIVAGLAYPTFAQSVVVLVRVDAAGQPDAGFGTNGVATFAFGSNDSEARGLKVLDNDRIIVAGSIVGDDLDRDAMLMRVSDDGSLDIGFGTNGHVTSNYAGEDLLWDVAERGDGRIVGCGYANQDFLQKAILFMVNSNGGEIADFGASGFLMPNLGSGDHTAYAMVAYGTELFVTGYIGNASGSDAHITCIRQDGALNPAFGTNGIALVDLNPLDMGLDIIQYSNGDFIIGGTTGENGFGVPRDFLVARFTSAGEPVMSFGTNGSVATSIQVDFDDVNALAIQPDGRIIAAGFTAGFSSLTDNDVAVVRYDVDWTLGAAEATNLALSRMYPNPASDLVTLDLGGEARAFVRVLDSAGRVAADFGWVRSGAPLTMPVAGLANGLYTVELRTAATIFKEQLLIAR